MNQETNMKSNFKFFILTVTLLFSLTLLFYSIIVIYYIFSNDYFYNRNFDNKEIVKIYYSLCSTLKYFL